MLAIYIVLWAAFLVTATDEIICFIPNVQYIYPPTTNIISIKLEKEDQ